ncbi:hypothetical protein GDI3820 [Gluconacetobacter diazotrophicus PA1 5]|uniref:Uncharacterized protein n=1 Tax=Gluconacetobacter diazotrophicus (strain ATCC 49037 / DSM 5601 / CCUG 37298 / CIP 103539 / LMG 7603 / PAl5) TaxID=272568 RepID=A9H9X4_GLUDA|nr:hypothetical protein GDI3820 [Gluconacetobacter diazotrophicus PA1 5]
MWVGGSPCSASAGHGPSGRCRKDTVLPDVDGLSGCISGCVQYFLRNDMNTIINVHL